MSIGNPDTRMLEAVNSELLTDPMTPSRPRAWWSRHASHAVASSTCSSQHTLELSAHKKPQLHNLANIRKRGDGLRLKCSHGCVFCVTSQKSRVFCRTIKVHCVERYSPVPDYSKWVQYVAPGLIWSNISYARGKLSQVLCADNLFFSERILFSRFWMREKKTWL